MPCFTPLDGWMSRKRTEIGKRRVSFSRRESYQDMKITVPCGKCLGCRMERARQWSVRCVHEASLWKYNCFITLTYEKLPADWKRDFVLFMKRLRKLYGPRVRFFHVGERGSRFGRPHHHALLFNCRFKDAVVFKRTSSGEVIYRSKTLEDLWSVDGKVIGFCSVGSVTAKSAAYVARYSVKKIDGKSVDYITMSRRPGLGARWLDKYYSDIYPNDVLITKGGVKGRPPRYYDERMRERDPKLFSRLKRKRVEAVDFFVQRGAARGLEVNLQARLDNNLKRSF